MERVRAEKKGVERRDWFNTDAARFDYHWYEIFNCVATKQRNIEHW